MQIGVRNTVEQTAVGKVPSQLIVGDVEGLHVLQVVTDSGRNLSREIVVTKASAQGILPLGVVPVQWRTVRLLTKVAVHTIYKSVPL